MRNLFRSLCLRWIFIVPLIGLSLFLIDRYKLNIDIISLLVAMGLLFLSFFFKYLEEKDFNKNLTKNLLNYDLECNLGFINDNIFLIKNRDATANPLTEIYYLNSEVLISVLNSHKILIYENEVIQNLLAFNNKVKTINNTIDKITNMNDLLRLNFFLATLKGARVNLRVILTALEPEGWWKENQLKGDQHTLDATERI